MTSVTPTVTVDVQVKAGALIVSAAFDFSGTLALIGPNGAGKTTLLRGLLGVVPARGRFCVDGKVLLDTGAGTSLPAEQRRIGYVPQSHGLFPHLTVRENVRFATTARHPALERPAIASRVDALLGRYALASLADRRPAQLSGGERQRVAIARAMASEPSLLLCDEPLAALDRLARREVRDTLAEYLSATGLPAVVVTHDPADTLALASTAVALDGGRIVETLDLRLPLEPSSAFARAFFAS